MKVYLRVKKVHHRYQKKKSYVSDFIKRTEQSLVDVKLYPNKCSGCLLGWGYVYMNMGCLHRLSINIAF